MRLLIIGFSMLLASPSAAKVLAEIEMRKITQKDVEGMRKQSKLSHPSALSLESPGDEYFLNKLIDLNLGLIDVERSELDQTEEAKKAIELALFNYYMYKTVDHKFKNKKFSLNEIKKYYKKNPIITFKRLIIPFSFRDTQSYKRAYSKISVLRSEIKSKKITFKQAIKKVGKHHMSKMNGTFDRVPVPALIPEERSAIKNLKPSEISTVIKLNGVVEIIKLIKIHPLPSDSIPSINERLKLEAIAKARDIHFKKLRKKYQNLIKIYK